jgi:hypothetical protein
MVNLQTYFSQNALYLFTPRLEQSGDGDDDFDFNVIFS